MVPVLNGLETNAACVGVSTEPIFSMPATSKLAKVVPTDMGDRIMISTLEYHNFVT